VEERSRRRAGRARRSQRGGSDPLRRIEMKGIALWLLGVPVILIVALYLFGIL
jgi:hypothetical protein